MSKIQTKTLKFTKSPSPDVVTNKLYLEEVPNEVTYESQSWDVGNNDVDGIVSIDLSTLSGIENIDGIFNVGVAAIDDVGNESSMQTLSNVPLDFIPPEMVGTIEII